jgi:hypothetical protein
MKAAIVPVDAETISVKYCYCKNKRDTSNEQQNPLLLTLYPLLN